jgi:hypothetical protein
VYRPWGLNGASGRSSVECNGETIASLQNGRLVTFTVPAGDHAFYIDSLVIKASVKGGERLYYRIESGLWSFKVRSATAAEAQSDIKQRDITNGDAQFIYLAECPAARRPAPPVRTAATGAGSGPGKIVIYFPWREGNWPWYGGDGVREQIRCNGRKAADLGTGRLVTLTAAPGEHILKFSNRDTAISVTSGATSYFRIGGPTAQLQPPADEAVAEIASLKIIPSESKYIEAAECPGPAGRKTTGR